MSVAPGLCLPLLVLCAAPPLKVDPKKPETWRLSAKLGKGSALRDLVLGEWAAPAAGPGEQALSRAEGEALLDDPRAELVYADKTISIVAPSMVAKQRADHIDLLKLFMKPERLAAAEQFFHDHRAVLERYGDKHKVDPAVIVSILTWESNLGTITGDYVAFSSFVSQAFFIEEANEAAHLRKAERAQWNAARQAERVEVIRTRARRNLAVLVRTCKSRGIDPLSVKGSWAGALGYPQFMPATLRWAEDGDGDGKIDLFTFDDSIASVARYLGVSGFAQNRQKAVWAYNHEQAYVDGVLTFADALTARLRSDAGVAPAERPADAGTDAGPR